MPACAELDATSAIELVSFLEKDRKGLSSSCVEFAIRQLADRSEELPVAETERAIDALLPFLDFVSTVAGRYPKWYPARNAIDATTNSSVERLGKAHLDPEPMKQRIVNSLMNVIAKPEVSRVSADNAALAVLRILAYPDAPVNALPAVAALAREATLNNDASSSARLRDEAVKLAATCSANIQSQCDAALR